MLALSAAACGDADGVRRSLRSDFCGGLATAHAEVHEAILGAQGTLSLLDVDPQERGRVCAGTVFELTRGEIGLHVAETRASSLASSRADGVDVAACGATLDLFSSEWIGAIHEINNTCLRGDRTGALARMAALEERTNGRLLEAQSTCATSGFVATTHGP